MNENDFNEVNLNGVIYVRKDSNTEGISLSAVAKHGIAADVTLPNELDEIWAKDDEAKAAKDAKCKADKERLDKIRSEKKAKKPVKKPAPRIATNRELARWLAQGNGELNILNTEIHTYFNYTTENANSECKYVIFKVRKWSDTEWHTPDVEYMGMEG